MKNGNASKLRGAILASAFRIIHLMAIHEDNLQIVSDQSPEAEIDSADRIPLSNRFSGLQEEDICYSDGLTGQCVIRGKKSFADTTINNASLDGLSRTLIDTASCANEMRQLDFADYQGRSRAKPSRQHRLRMIGLDYSRPEGFDIRQYLQTPASSNRRPSDEAANSDHQGSKPSEKALELNSYDFFTTTKTLESNDATHCEIVNTEDSSSSFSDTDSLFDDFIATDSPSSVGPSDSISNIINPKSHFQVQRGTQQHPVQPFIRPHSHADTISLPFESPIPVITSSDRIQTCFRIAEVRRLVASTTSNEQLTIELYAQVIDSSRDGEVQEIQFADLFFPARPPYIFGSYRAWKECELFDEDSKAFLTREAEVCQDRRQQQISLASQSTGRLCKAIIKAKGQDQDSKRTPVSGKSTRKQLAGSQAQRANRFAIEVAHGQNAIEAEVLAIWETDWNDVHFVRGIVEPRSDT